MCVLYTIHYSYVGVLVPDEDVVRGDADGDQNILPLSGQLRLTLEECAPGVTG